jgi:TonB-dependent siderophore receptor
MTVESIDRGAACGLGRVTRILLASTFAAGAFVSVAQAQDGASPTELQRIEAKGSSYETEDTKSYTTDLVSVGEKDVRPVREIPQSTTVITRERLQDGGYTSLDTALRETSGIMVLNNDNGRSSLFSRGFEFDYLYFNGLPAPLSSVYGTQPDMAIIDHVEILRGPAGLFGGAGEPAGAVNMRLKQAKSEFEARFEGTYGSWNHRRAEVDVTGPLNEAGTLRGRFVGALQGGDGFIDAVENGTGVLYGTVQADLTPNTTATFSISHMARDIKPFNGLPTYANGALLDIDRSTTTGADWNNFDNAVTDYIAEIEHKFEEGGHAKLSARYQSTDVDFLYAWANGYVAPNGDIVAPGGDSRWLARKYDSGALSMDAHISKPFELFGLEHNVILGIDYQNQDLDTLQGGGVINVQQNIFDWKTNIPKPVVTYNSQTGTKIDQFGAYGQLRVKPFERLTLVGGGRLTWYDTTTRNLITNVETGKQGIDAKFTPYAGVVFDLTDWLSAYSSYTEIFKPQTATDVAGRLIEPREGRQYEIGLKAELFDSGVNASIAYFNLRDVNRAVDDPANPGFSLAQGEVEVSGFELEMSGTVLPGLEVAGGYTYTDSRYLNTAAAGQTFSTYTPRHMLQLWTKYAFDESHGILDGVFIGGGVTAFSSFSSVSGPITIKAPGYATVDLFAGYNFNENVTATLSVNNVFDKKYYARVGSNSVFNFYGEPLNANLRLSAKF